jgi:FtsP/CotA-like multicopper oxidase with cupredoxin domain
MRPTRRRFLVASLAATGFSRVATADDGFKILEARTGSLRLLPEPAAETPVWTFNGSVPAPLLRFKKGEESRLRLVNKLEQPIALHFQGVRIANPMDGAVGLTRASVAPGQSFDYRFTPPDSGTFWYRSSIPANAAEQNARGLYGLLVVDEAEPPAVDLDLPVVIADWRLDAKGLISGPFPSPPDAVGAGRIGDLMTVNSAALPLAVEQRPGSRIRLRLLNACNARLMAATFENLDVRVVAIDGQPCDPFPPARQTIPLGPGARFDVMFDLPLEDGAKSSIKLRGGGLRSDSSGEADRDLVVFTAKGDKRTPSASGHKLPLNPLLPLEIKLQNAQRLDLNIEGPSKDPRKVWTFNKGAGAVGAKPLFSVKRGQPVTLGFINKTSVAQSIHVHGHVMRVLHLLDDGWEPYWRDSVIIAPGKTARVAFIADNPGKWLIDSTILEHAASGLSAWFEVA